MINRFIDNQKSTKTLNKQKKFNLINHFYP